MHETPLGGVFVGRRLAATLVFVHNVSALGCPEIGPAPGRNTSMKSFGKKGEEYRTLRRKHRNLDKGLERGSILDPVVAAKAKKAKLALKDQMADLRR